MYETIETTLFLIKLFLISLKVTKVCKIKDKKKTKKFRFLGFCYEVKSDQIQGTFLLFLSSTDFKDCAKINILL